MNALLRDPAKRAQFDAAQAEINSILRTNTSLKDKQSGTVYTIPVVVHVVHLGEPVGTGTNISDQQIYDAIDGMNQRWRDSIGDGVDMGVQFCLATTAPNNQPTTGILRENGSLIPNYASSGINTNSCTSAADETVVKANYWPLNKYYNIYVVNKICGNFSGYAYYPQASNPIDGAAIVYSYMKKNSTIPAHELGHAFFLYHTFEGGTSSCPLNNDCSTDGDKICDTPPHKQTDCDTSSPCTSSGVWANSLHNYMSYCPVLTRFTADQKTRVLASVAGAVRSPLTTSNKCAVAASVGLQANNVFAILPNPSSGRFIIEKKNHNTEGIRIYDLLGNVVRECNGSAQYTNIDLSDQPKGMYIIQVPDNGKYYSMQLVVQ